MTIACCHHVGKIAAMAKTVCVPLPIQKGGADGDCGAGWVRAAQRTAADDDECRSGAAEGIGWAFRWKRLLDDGTYACVSDIARAEKLDRTSVGDVLRLTLLTPSVVQVIVKGRQAARITLPMLLNPWPLEWGTQREALSALPFPLAVCESSSVR